MKRGTWRLHVVHLLTLTVYAFTKRTAVQQKESNDVVKTNHPAPLVAISINITFG